MRSICFEWFLNSPLKKTSAITVVFLGTLLPNAQAARAEAPEEVLAWLNQPLSCQELLQNIQSFYVTDARANASDKRQGLRYVLDVACSERFAHCSFSTCKKRLARKYGAQADIRPPAKRPKRSVTRSQFLIEEQEEITAEDLIARESLVIKKALLKEKRSEIEEKEKEIKKVEEIAIKKQFAESSERAMLKPEPVKAIAAPIVPAVITKAPIEPPIKPIVEIVKKDIPVLPAVVREEPQKVEKPQVIEEPLLVKATVQKKTAPAVVPFKKEQLAPKVNTSPMEIIPEAEPTEPSEPLIKMTSAELRAQAIEEFNGHYSKFRKDHAKMIREAVKREKAEQRYWSRQGVASEIKAIEQRLKASRSSRGSKSKSRIIRSRRSKPRAAPTPQRFF